MSSYHLGGFFLMYFLKKRGKRLPELHFAKDIQGFSPFFVRPVGLETKRFCRTKGDNQEASGLLSDVAP